MALALAPSRSPHYRDIQAVGPTAVKPADPDANHSKPTTSLTRTMSHKLSRGRYVGPVSAEIPPPWCSRSLVTRLMDVRPGVGNVPRPPGFLSPRL